MSNEDTAVKVEEIGAAESQTTPMAPRPEWTRPTLTRIDIKRTQAAGGSGIDGSLQTTP